MVRASDLPYRPCVGALVLNRDGLVFIGQRGEADGGQKSPYSWQMPQGGIDSGEDPLSAVRREVFEETNIRSLTLLDEAPEWYRYDLPAEILRRSWKGRYRGQTQKWFAFRFDGEECEINVLNPGHGHKPEFIAWRWIEIEALPDLIVPFKRQVYLDVVKAFRHLAKPA